MAVDPRLQALRDRIDTVDEKLLDLLRERAEIVEEVRDVKGKLPIYIRPGREADMMRSLLAKSMGRVPAGLVNRLWREMIGAFTLQEGRLRVSVAVKPGDEGMWDYARDHFGGFTPLSAVAAPEDALNALQKGECEVACLPCAYEGHGWWRRLLAPELAAIKLFYRFPFDGVTGNARPAQGDALAFADLMPEPTSDDRTVLVVEWRGAAKLENLPYPVARHVVAVGEGARPCSWIELSGFLLTDEKLGEWRKKHKEDILRDRIVGAYPVPLKAA